METEKSESKTFIARSKRTKKVYAVTTKDGTNLCFNFQAAFYPRISGLFDKLPKHKDILAFYRVGDNGIPEAKKRVGFFDFSTIDLNDICPNGDYKKEKEIAVSGSDEDSKSSDPSSKDEDSSEDDDYSSSGSGDGEDPNDEDYDEAPWDVRLASCPEHVTYNHMPFEIHFHIDREKLTIRVKKLIYVLVKNVDR